MMKYILASSSPRRVEIAKQLGLAFETRVSDAEANLSTDISDLSPEKRVEFLSLLKAADIARELVSEGEEEYLIIGSDTVVAVEEQILEKPKSKEDAGRMMDLLQGKAHEVFTGVSLIRLKKDRPSLCQKESRDRAESEAVMEWLKKYQEGDTSLVRSFVDRTKVWVYEMTKEEIEAYISTKEPYDKAGGYAIQGGFSRFIKGIEGDYFTVMGLPSGRLYQEIKAFLIE